MASLSTQQSQLMNRTDPQIVQLLRELSASLQNLARKTSQVHEEMRHGNDLFEHHHDLMQQHLEKTLELHKEGGRIQKETQRALLQRNFELVDGFGRIQQKLIQSMERMGIFQEQNPKTSHTHAVHAQNGNRINPFDWSQSSVQNKQSSEVDSNSSIYLKAVQIDLFIKNSLEKLQQIGLCSLSYEEFEQKTRGILDSIERLVLVKGNVGNEGLAALSDLRVSVQKARLEKLRRI